MASNRLFRPSALESFIIDLTAEAKLLPMESAVWSRPCMCTANIVNAVWMATSAGLGLKSSDAALPVNSVGRSPSVMSHDSWDTNAKDCLIPVIEAAVKAGLPLEINGNGIARPMKETSSGLRYMYPVREFWKEAKARKALVVCNSDAHSPKVVVSQAVMARQFAEEMGIKVLDRLSFMDR